MATIGHFLNQLTDIVSGWISYPLVFLLLGTGFFITVKLRFLQIRKLYHSFRVVTGAYDNPEDEGDVTHFQALATALSATIGIGNIAGVAIALRLGGPGALFWMWVTAIFGMVLKYAECSLSHRYRVIHEDGSASGGPMYYIEKGLGWKPLALIFAICATVCSFCTGNMNQANTIAEVIGIYGIPTIGSGLLIAFLVGLVIIGGIKRIASVASKIVPLMAILYCGGAFVIILMNFENIFPSLASIFYEAFQPKASLGGVFVVIMWGIRRGLYSNEAGQGSAPIAHAAAKTKESVREGAVALMGPFIDTLVVCSFTGFVILVTGALNVTDSAGVLLMGAKITRAAFEIGFSFSPQLGSWIVTLSVFFFAYSTIIAWSYYGDRSIEYLIGPKAVMPYRYAYVFFTFLGSILPLVFVWNFGDIALSLMTIPNLIAIIFLSGNLSQMTKDYFSRKHMTYKEQLNSK